MSFQKRWLPISKTPPSRPKRSQFSHEMHLKIQLLSRGLKPSNPEPGCTVSGLLLREKDATNLLMAFWHWAHLNTWVFFSVFYPSINPCFTAEKRIDVWTLDTKKRPSSVYVEVSPTSFMSLWDLLSFFFLSAIHAGGILSGGISGENSDSDQSGGDASGGWSSDSAAYQRWMHWWLHWWVK